MPDIVNWKKVINSLPGPFPETGKPPPKMEMIPVGKKKDLGLDDNIEFSKLQIEIFFIVDKKTGKEYTMQRHHKEEYGDLTFREALQAIKR